MSQLLIDDVKTHIESAVTEIACLACSAGSVRMTVCSDFVGDILTPVYTVVRKMQYAGNLVAPDIITESFNEDELARAIYCYNQGQHRLGL